MPSPKSPIIRLPEDAKKVAYLKRKLAEYNALRSSPRNYKAPEQQMFLICAGEVLTELTKGRLDAFGAA